MQRCSHYLLVDVVHVGEFHTKYESLRCLKIKKKILIKEKLLICFVSSKSFGMISFEFFLCFVLPKISCFVRRFYHQSWCTTSWNFFLHFIIILNVSESLFWNFPFDVPARSSQTFINDVALLPTEIDQKSIFLTVQLCTSYHIFARYRLSVVNECLKLYLQQF